MSTSLTQAPEVQGVIDAAAAAPVASNPATAEKSEALAVAVATAGTQELSKVSDTTVNITLTAEQVKSISEQITQGKTEVAEKIVTEATAAAAATAGTTTFTSKVPAKGSITTIATTQPASTKAEQVEQAAQTSNTLAI